ncbi:MAG: nuclear transport factor 2 family protein [Candidatus Binatia bacterium]
MHRRPLSAAETQATAPLAERWLQAWNAHDVDRILALYATGARHTSQHVRAITGGGDTLRGRDAIGAYVRRSLLQYPSLRFEPVSVATGPWTVVIEYRAHGVGTGESTVELFELDADGLIVHARAYQGSMAADGPHAS